MAIEKMMYVNIVGFADYLDETINRCVAGGCFHIEEAGKTVTDHEDSFQQIDEENPYKELLKKVLSIKLGKEYKFTQADTTDVDNMPMTEMTEYVNKIADEVEKINTEREKYREELKDIGQTLELLEHLKDMKVDLEKFFNMESLHIRFGKLPNESYEKLSFYSDELFEFISYDSDTNYHWGLYFTTSDTKNKVDKIMTSLYFERIFIPDFVNARPQEEISNLNKKFEETFSHLEDLTDKRREIATYNFIKLNKIYCKLKTFYDNFNLRSKAVLIKNNFYLVGFVPMADIPKLSKSIEDLPSVEVVVRPPDTADKFTTPVKLKNNRFSRPFAMFVEMYGLPSYKGFNPTNLVAITYTLLFGIMFGDLGQGLVIALFGLILNKVTKNEFGAILLRIGCSSAIFGLVYGSVFGFEHALNPLYQNIGLEHSPLEVMENTNFVLMAAIGIGASIIFLSILINIVTSFRRKNYQEAVFGNNGIVGFVFFGAILAGIAVPFVTDVKLFTPVYIIGLIVLPLVMMFFREPLGAILKGEKFKIHGGIGDFIATNFFECFEFLLGYATNTLSFIRIGGFVFSHAGMMSVVMLLSEMAGGGASIAVVIIGNLFVMLMEGFIVGIQVLRLEFYEIFSRFYDGDGRAFNAAKVKYDTAIE
jgi:V/A-type H+-transporting ATPase subunit I